MIRHIFAIALLLGPSLIGAGCGYRVMEYQSEGGSAPTICVITLSNDSEVPGLELMASEAIRKAVISRGGLRLTSDPAAADYVLRGRVLPVKTYGRTFTGVVLALEYSAELSMEVSIRGKQGADLRLSSRDLSASDLYLASADLEAGRKNRDEALRRLAQLLARRIHDVVDRELLSEARQAGP